MSERDFDQLVIERLAGLPGPEGKTYDVTITPDTNEPAFVVFGTIRLSSHFLRYLWWASALFLLRYRASFDSMKAEAESDTRKPLTEYDPRLREAYHNFASCRASALDREVIPDVVEVALSASEAKQADGLFLRSVAWVIYHETAHIELGHAQSTIENEHEADRYATERIASWLDEADEGFSSRFGQMVAMFAMMSLEQSGTQAFSETTHPPVYRRALSRLEQFGLEENADEYYFSTLMLRGELLEIGVDLSNEPKADSVLGSLTYHIRKLEAHIAQNQTSAT